MTRRLAAWLPLKMQFGTMRRRRLTGRKPLAFDAPEGVEDGVYDVECFGRIYGPGCFITGQPEPEEDCQVGVTVAEGKYDPVATAEAVYRVVLNVFNLDYGSRQFDSVYIEELDFNPETRRFTVFLGS